jgi:hypothetical protein
MPNISKSSNQQKVTNDGTPLPPQGHDTDLLDEALEDSFPASDPLPVQPGADKEGD